MKQVSVICNNPQEWHHFKVSTEWVLSKANKPYKSTDNLIIDISEQITYTKALLTPVSKPINGQTIVVGKFIARQQKLYPKHSAFKRLFSFSYWKKLYFKQ